MKYTPGAVQPSDLDIAEATYIGGEFAVYLAEKQANNLGLLELNSSGNGANPPVTWTPRPGASIQAPTGSSQAAADLCIVAETRLLSPNGNCTVTFNVVDDLGATTTATATFAPATRSTDQSGNVARGFAQDLTVATGATRKIASITGVASVVNGYRGVKFKVYQLPEWADYVLVGDTTTLKFNTKARTAVGIDSGLESDKYVKLGKTKKGDLTIDSKYNGIFDGLQRKDGARCTALLIGVKEQVLTMSQYVFVDFIPTVTTEIPDGEGEVMANAADGKFKDHLFFEAP